MGLAKKFNVPDRWLFHCPDRDIDLIYYTIDYEEGEGGMSTGISEAAFNCGLRLPFLPIPRSLLRDMGITLGKLDPNSFIYVNVFQHKCLQTGVVPRTRLFWFHYDLKKNPKSPGFYSVSRRAGRPDWYFTNSNNKGSHDSWFFLSSSSIEEFSVWREVDPKRVKLPKLSDAEKQDYASLCRFPEVKIPVSHSRSAKWLGALMGSFEENCNPFCFFNCFESVFFSFHFTNCSYLIVVSTMDTIEARRKEKAAAAAVARLEKEKEKSTDGASGSIPPSTEAILEPLRWRPPKR